MNADQFAATTAKLVPSGYRLRLPGPTTVPERVRQALALPLVSHRGPEFRHVLADCMSKLRPVIGTRADIFFIGGSGTAGMEAALVNVLAPDDPVLVVNCGQFGERFVSIGRELGADVDQVEVAWGEAPDPAALAARLKAKRYRAVACVHNESSTGVVTDIAAIGALLAGTDTLLIVDSVSGLGGIAMRMDEWGVDILVAASQKCLMCPPGLVLMAVSEKAMAVIEKAATVPRFYFDLRRAKAAGKNGETAFTPPVSLAYGLREALTMMHEESVAQVLQRHSRMAAALQAGCIALGLALLPPPHAISATVTVARVPDGLEGSAIVRQMYAQYKTVIAGQRTKLHNKVIRLGTMGAITAPDVLTDLQQLEDTLRSLGQPVRAGAGTQAAAAVLAGAERY
jgi:aspartate aminotransferase-like enzyme